MVLEAKNTVEAEHPNLDKPEPKREKLNGHSFFGIPLQERFCGPFKQYSAQIEHKFTG